MWDDLLTLAVPFLFGVVCGGIVVAHALTRAMKNKIALANQVIGWWQEYASLLRDGYEGREDKHTTDNRLSNHIRGRHAKPGNGTLKA